MLENQIFKSIVILVAGVPFLLGVWALGTLLIYVGVNSIQTQTAKTTTATLGRQNPLGHKRRNMRFSGRAAQVHGVAAICLGVMFFVEPTVAFVNLFMNECLPCQTEALRRKRKRNLLRVSWGLRLAVGFWGLLAFVV